MMTEPYTETIRGNADSPYDYPVLTADLVLCHFESAVAHEAGTVIDNLPADGETVTVAHPVGPGTRTPMWEKAQCRVKRRIRRR